MIVTLATAGVTSVAPPVGFFQLDLERLVALDDAVLRDRHHDGGGICCPPKLRKPATGVKSPLLDPRRLAVSPDAVVNSDDHAARRCPFTRCTVERDAARVLVDEVGHSLAELRLPGRVGLGDRHRGGGGGYDGGHWHVSKPGSARP